MKKVILRGKLGKLFGREHYFQVANIAEAIRGLSANFPEFKKYLIDPKNKNILYKVENENTPIGDNEEFFHPLKKTAQISFTPMIEGAESGALRFFAGAALIGISFIPGIGTATSAAILAGGIGLSLGGVVQLLTPIPKFPGIDKVDGTKPSYIFNGPINTSVQGFPVAVGYGRVRVGSAVASASIITSEDLG